MRPIESFKKVKSWDDFFNIAAEYFGLSESQAIERSKFRWEPDSPQEAFEELEESYHIDRLLKSFNQN